MGEKKETGPDVVSFYQYEGMESVFLLIIKQLIIALVISIILGTASNIAWVVAWTQYEYSASSVSVNSKDGGNANYIGNDGDILNGADHSEEILP